MSRCASQSRTPSPHRGTRVTIALCGALAFWSCGGGTYQPLRECRPQKPASFQCNSGGVVTSNVRLPTGYHPKPTSDFGCHFVVHEDGALEAIGDGAMCLDVDVFHDLLDDEDRGTVFTRVCVPPKTEGVWALEGTGGSDISMLVNDGGVTCW